MRRNTFLQKIVIGLLATLALPGTAKVHSQEISRQQADSIMKKFIVAHDSVERGTNNDGPFFPYHVFGGPGKDASTQNTYAYLILSYYSTWGPKPTYCLFVDKTNGNFQYQDMTLPTDKIPSGYDWRTMDMYWQLDDYGFLESDPIIHISRPEAERALDRFLEQRYPNGASFPYQVHMYPDSTKNLVTWYPDSLWHPARWSEKMEKSSPVWANLYMGETGVNFSFFHENTFVYMLVEEKTTGPEYTCLAALKNDPAIGFPSSLEYLPGRILPFEITDLSVQALPNQEVSGWNRHPRHLEEWPIVRSYDPASTNLSTQTASTPRLESIQPNPFHQTTLVRYYLPESVHKASLQVFDLHGRLLQSLPLEGRGTAEARLDLSAQAPGLYIGILVVDGQTADRIRLIKIQ